MIRTNNLRLDFTELNLDTLRIEDKSFQHRISLLFLAESLMFVTYISSFSLKEGYAQLISLVIGTFGLSVTSCYTFVLWRHADNINRIKDNLKGIYYNYNTLKRLMEIGWANLILGKIVPWIFIVAWSVLLIINTRWIGFW